MSNQEIVGRMQDRFAFRVALVVETVKDRMHTSEQLLRGGVGLFNASGTVSREQWHEYVENAHMSENYPGIQTMAVDFPIPAAGKKAHIARVRAEGHADYTIRPEEPERPIYYPLVYIEPFSGRNLRAFGFDMYTNPTRRAAMDRAIDLGLPSMSGMVRLVQETDQEVQNGLIYCLPVYHNGSPIGTPDQRRAALRALVSGAFRINDLMTGIFGNSIDDLELEIFDDGVIGPNTRLYTSHAEDSLTTSGLFKDVPIEIGGRKWLLRVKTNQKFLQHFPWTQSNSVAVAGISLSIALFFVIGSLTRRKREEHALTMMKYSIDHMDYAVHWVNKDAKIVYANEAMCRKLGYSMEEMLNMSIPDIDPDFPVEKWPAMWEQFKQQGAMIFESRHRTKSGEIFPVEINLNHLRFQEHDLNCVYARDITGRKKTEEELKLSALVLKNSSEGMLVTDENNQIIAVNPAFTIITGYNFEEVKGKNPRIFRSGRHDQAFYQAMWQSLKIAGQWQGEIWDKRKNGDIHAKWLTINTIRNVDGSVHRYVALFSDITEKKQSEELIWQQANFDPLTALPNRRMFHDRLEQEILKSERTDLPLALLLIDLDEFKEVNDTLGHDQGDILLQEAALRITDCVRVSDTVARLGGDEFIVVLSQLTETNHAADIAQKILDKLSETFHLGSKATYISASIGITLYPSDATSIESLMKNADQAMYLSKYLGRNRFSYFTPALQEAAQKRLQLTNELRGALVANQFEVFYQPIVELATGNIHKAEALIRWHHPQRGLVSPAEFIPLAEETGLIVEIGFWVFQQAAHQVQLWQQSFNPAFKISVNRSPVQFQDHYEKNHLPCLNYLQDMQLSGKSIIFEITEGLLLDAHSGVTDALLKFRDAGIQVALDDFGTGYSSLSYLKKFDIDYLKIDKSFVDHLATDSNDVALCEAIIVMAHKLGLKVIAEGVESEEQRSLLADAGCDFGQGYLFSRPVPPEKFEELLAV